MIIYCFPTCGGAWKAVRYGLWVRRPRKCPPRMAGRGRRCGPAKYRTTTFSRLFFSSSSFLFFFFFLVFLRRLTFQNSESCCSKQLWYVYVVFAPVGFPNLGCLFFFFSFCTVSEYAYCIIFTHRDLPRYKASGSTPTVRKETSPANSISRVVWPSHLTKFSSSSRMAAIVEWRCCGLWIARGFGS